MMALPNVLQTRIFDLLAELTKARDCCHFHFSQHDVTIRDELNIAYHELKNDLLSVGMSEDDTILLRIRKEHLEFQQTMLASDSLALDLDMYRHGTLPSSSGQK